jgi:lipoyl(octanoyl) transferase
MKEKVKYEDIGLIDYKVAWDYQTEVHSGIKSKKLKNRSLSKEEKALLQRNHRLIFCQHHPVYTLGKSGSVDHLLLSETELANKGFTYYKINRGGDITYHGPGQLVAYPIFDLDWFFHDVHKYVRLLEEVIIKTLAAYDLKASRIEGFTGVWFKESNILPKRKICAIGVHMSRWVTLHGLAFNINPNLSHFNNIVPCGINDEDKIVTSLSTELQTEVDFLEVSEKVKYYFSEVFDFEYSRDI